MKPLEEDALIKGIVVRVLECDEDQRQTMVHEECAGNEELIAKVFSILEGEEQETLTDGGTDFPASKVGPYTLRRAIGEGGFAEVFLAEQEEPVCRTVALKILKPGMDSRELLARFEVERQALALMQHSGVAKIFDAGITESGRSWFAMEHVEGVSITDYCDKNRLGLRERLGLFNEVCEAVQHAHQKGVIHRDIKPSNILVGLSEGKPRVKVIDFGIAKATGPSLTEKTLFTAQGMLIGTPAYMSPEQAEMSGADIDTRSDVYSLGILLYELMVGEPPFHPKRLLQAGYGEILRIIREEHPQKLSAKSTTIGDLSEIAASRKLNESTLSRRLNGDLDWITLKALEKDRTRRYSTIQELASDVSRHLNNEPVTAGPPSMLYSFKKFVRRNRIGVSAAAATFLTLTSGVIISTWQWREARSAKEAAIQSKVEAQESREIAIQEREKAIEAAKMEKEQRRIAQIQNNRSYNVISWYGEVFENIDLFVAGNALEKEIKERGVTESLDYPDISRLFIDQVFIEPLTDSIKKKFAGDMSAQNDLYFEISELLYNLGFLKKAHAINQMCYENVRKENADIIFLFENSFMKYLTAEALGQSCYDLENFQEAERLFSEALLELAEIEKTFSSREDFETSNDLKGRILNRLAIAKTELFKYDESREIFRQSVDLGNREAMEGLARLEIDQGNLKKAEVILLAILNYKQRDSKEKIDIVDFERKRLVQKGLLSYVYKEMARISGKVEKYDEAESLLQEILKFRKQHSGLGHINTIIANEELAALYVSKSMLLEAESIFRSCLKDYEELNDFKPNYVRCYYKLISCVFQQGKVEEGRRLKEELISLSASLDDRVFGALKAEIVLELVRLDREDSSLTTKQLRMAVEQAVKYKVDKGITAKAYTWLGTAELDSRNYEKSQEYLEKAYSISMDVDPKSSDTAQSASLLGHYWKRVKRFDLAERFYRESLAIHRGFEKNVATSYHLALSLESLGCFLKDLGRLVEAKVFLVELIELLEKYPEVARGINPQLVEDLVKAKNLNEKLDLFGDPFGPKYSVDISDELDPFAPREETTE